MADLCSSPSKADATCWQCGAPADTGCAYRMRLFAEPSRRLDSRGYLVKRGSHQDIVTIAIPRCRTCRSRGRISLTIIFIVTLAAGVAAPFVQSKFWPQFDTPPGAALFQYGVGPPATGVGLLLGFVVSLLGCALYRQYLGARSLATYPPVRMLRREGWHGTRGG